MDGVSGINTAISGRAAGESSRQRLLGPHAWMVVRFDPATFRDLQRLCARCEYPTVPVGFEAGSRQSVWQKHRRNWATLGGLALLRWSAGVVALNQLA